MCGFLAVFSNQNLKEQSSYYRDHAKKIAHRGNSAYGELIEEKTAFFHYRLSFLDLARGSQPMQDPKGEITLIYNGELYDFHTLRSQLNYDFQTHSDTEVILAGYLQFGEKIFEKIDGEFACVLYDKKNKKIIAARDRYGVKPIFWHTDISLDHQLHKFKNQYEESFNYPFYFASEIKALPVNLSWDQRGLHRSFSSLYEEMGTSFKNTFSLAPGSVLTFHLETNQPHFHLKRILDKKRIPKSSTKSFWNSASDIKQAVSKTVTKKLEADVPLGAYLSGGIDSRIAALEMSQSGKEIETFTVGFESDDYDETPLVKDFLQNFPTLKGRALKLTNQSLEYAYPHAVYASELIQPYTNGSAKWWLSLFARRFVQGVLTGDGSDEIFCGYPSYRYLAWWNFYSKQPGDRRKTLYASKVMGKNEKAWEKGISSQSYGEDLLNSFKTLGFYHPLFSQIQFLLQQLAQTDLLAKEKENLLSYINEREDPLTNWQNYFLYTHFPTHVLNWVGDRMEMANTLEGRPIFLSREIYEATKNLPNHFLVRGMQEKAILRAAYKGQLQRFAYTPKKQFNAPFLFNSTLGDRYLSKSSLIKTGLFDPSIVTRIKEQQQAEKDPLTLSFINIFLQNCLVTQMIDEYIVQKKPPERNISFETEYLDKGITNL
ncbi:MAG: asparagine synthetase B [Oligoflexia bacterium]|nr:asparagine synthetase B [Oligoflexia bacterium]